MLDLSHISSQQQSTFTFYATGNWQTWNKPRNAKLIQIFCLGSGAAGGTATTSAAGIAGAGGGGSGGIVRGIIPAFLLPDTLYILVAKGGSQAAGATTDGAISYVSLNRTTTEATLICKSSTVAAGVGQIGGSVLTAAAVAVTTLSAFGNLGMFTAIAGVAGTVGGTSSGTSGTSQTALATSLVTGGAGGGGKTASVSGSGGNINSASAVLTTTVAGGITEGQAGANGYGTLSPFCGTGGAGGAGIRTGVSGKGGNGWYGCGGGGSGGCSIAGAKGGDGGDGLVIITVIS